MTREQAVQNLAERLLVSYVSDAELHDIQCLACDREPIALLMKIAARMVDAEVPAEEA